MLDERAGVRHKGVRVGSNEPGDWCPEQLSTKALRMRLFLGADVATGDSLVDMMCVCVVEEGKRNICPIYF